MHTNLNLNDLTRLGIPEAMVAQCFAQKGIAVRLDDVAWMRKSFIATSTAETKGTVQEISDLANRTSKSFVSVNEETSVANESFIQLRSPETQAFLKNHLDELDWEDLEGAQRIILPNAEAVFGSKNPVAFKALWGAVEVWMDKLQDFAPITYFYLALHFGFGRVAFDQNPEAYMQFHRLKSDLICDENTIHAIKNDQKSHFGREKLMRNLEVLDREMGQILQSSGGHERIGIRDHSNHGFVRELHFGEALKVTDVSLGNTHALWKCAFEDREVLFGIGDNSHGQITINVDIKYFNRPILIDCVQEKSVRGFGAFGEVSCATDGTDLFVWGRNVRKDHVSGKGGLVTSIKDVFCMGNNIFWTSPENQVLTSSFKDSWDPKEVGRLSGAISSLGIGSSHFLCLTTDGKMYGFGSNRFHQLSDSLSKTEFRTLEVIDNPSSDDSVIIFCQNDMSIVLDAAGVCHFFGKINDKKEIRYPESIEVFESGQKIPGKSFVLTGNDKKVVAYLGEAAFEWNFQSSMKFKPKNWQADLQTPKPPSIEVYRLSKMLELVEYRVVFGPNCEFKVKNEKIRKNEPIECQVIFRDAKGAAFKAPGDKEIIHLTMTKSAEMGSDGILPRSGFVSLLHSDSGLEIKNSGLADLSVRNLVYQSPHEITFEVRCGTAGLYMFSLFCNCLKVKGEFLMEILRSAEVEETPDDINQIALKTFLTGSSFKTVTSLVHPEAVLSETMETLRRPPSAAPIKPKLKPITEDPKITLTNQLKRPVARFSSIKLKRADDSSKSFFDDKFPGKIKTKLPHLPDIVLNPISTRGDKLVFRKAEKKV
jgi:hypothetical protein